MSSNEIYRTTPMAGAAGLSLPQQGPTDSSLGCGSRKGELLDSIADSGMMHDPTNDGSIVAGEVKP
jgi:hypothetical protein